jgi:hypothetical protein
MGTLIDAVKFRKSVNIPVLSWVGLNLNFEKFQTIFLENLLNSCDCRCVEQLYLSEG